MKSGFEDCLLKVGKGLLLGWSIGEGFGRYEGSGWYECGHFVCLLLIRVMVERLLLWSISMWCKGYFVVVWSGYGGCVLIGESDGLGW